MSTIHSPPAPEQSSHPIGFNEQSHYDPFFPSSPSEEQLVPIKDEHTPSQLSLHSPSPPHGDQVHVDESRKSSAASMNDGQGLQAPQAPYLQGHTSSLSPNSHNEGDNSNGSYDFLSPNAYLSDNGYIASSEHTATPEYGDGFYLEDDFGVLDNSEQDVVRSDLTTGTNHSQTATVPHIDATSTFTKQTPAGTATLPPQLMSPVLTDTNGTTSRQGTASPTMATAYMRPENSYFAPPALNIAAIHQANMHQNLHQMQQTPTATNTSKGSSPDFLPAIPHVPRAPSPVVRVENYHRGDSPTRVAGLSGAASNKRSRAGSKSSHLAVEDSSSSEGGEQTVDGSYNISSTGVEAGNDARKGLDPDARFRVRDVDVPSFKEQEETTQLAMKKADVEEWLDRSDPASKADPEAPPAKPSVTKRRRAKSAGAQTLSKENLESLEYAPPDAHIPGPGLLLDVDSGEDEEASDMDTDDTASIENSPPPTVAAGEEPVNDVPGQARPGVYNELPNQPPSFRAKLWQDPIYDSSNPGVKMQPVSSNDAIVRFQQRAMEIDGLSRVATWGTRRVSDSDLHSLFRQFSISERPHDASKGKRERSGSFLQQAAAKLKPKRNSTLKNPMKRQESDSTIKEQPPTRPVTMEHARNDSSGSGNLGVPHMPSTSLKRMPSLSKKPKSPKINTGSAVAAMTSQIAALGASGPVSATATSSPPGPWTATKMVIKRSRSRSDLHNGVNNSNGLGSHGPGSSSATELGLTDLWSKQGGPPMPTLAAPKIEDPRQGLADDEDDEEEDEIAEEHGVTMDLAIQPDPIEPTLSGFRTHVRKLNPRLPPYMIDRIAQEQLRRYKKLLDFKIKHTQALAAGKCASGRHCIELGGEPTYLPAKTNGRDTDITHAGFSVSGMGASEDDVNALADGIVTPAQFPPGVPMPPVKRLPAEFECSLCFKVKKFQKPSDWSKHVHEDVQPFTCTFATCAEPKSFKRKADWVRHENERHRQLEWWMCNMNDCSHKCYRKDNFVQHLVREHKLPEPKVKTQKTGKPAVRGPSSQKARNSRLSDENGDEPHDETDQVWRLVEVCRHETQKNPKDEPCKFCGNICNSWKKLTVHLAKHMEQISMPVLGVVKQKEVTTETIVSPIEQRLASHQASMSPTAQSPFSQPSLSSFGQPMMQDIPPGFTAIQPPVTGYFGNPHVSQETVNYHRASPNTYPPPNSNTIAYNGANFGQSHHDASYPVSQFAVPTYVNSSAPTSSAPNDTQQGYSSHPTSSSPENFYPGNFHGPTSQPRSSPYDESHGFQYMSNNNQVPQQQQQHQHPQPQANFVNSPVDGSQSQFNNTPASYPPYSSSQVTQAPMGTNIAGTMDQNVGLGMSYPGLAHGGQSHPQQQQYSHNSMGVNNLNGTGMGFNAPAPEGVYMQAQNPGQGQAAYRGY